MHADIKVSLEQEDVLEAIRHYVEMVYGKWPAEVKMQGSAKVTALASWSEEPEGRDDVCED